MCLEIWNLVFIQYNAEADGTFRDLPSQHVDTGMGFERACSLIQNTKGFTDSDIFTPIFDEIQRITGPERGRPASLPRRRAGER